MNTPQSISHREPGMEVVETEEVLEVRVEFRALPELVDEIRAREIRHERAQRRIHAIRRQVAHSMHHSFEALGQNLANLAEPR